MTMEEYKKNLLEDQGLIDYLNDEDIVRETNTEWLYEKFLYFMKCLGDNCKYAEACIKLMKEEIDGFYSGRATNNVT